MKATQVVENNAESESKPSMSWPDIATSALIITLGVAALGLEIYGFENRSLRYMGTVIVLLVVTLGLSGFTSSYNRLVRAPDMSAVRNRLRLTAEKAAAAGVVSLTLGIALGLYTVDATNSEANFSKNGGRANADGTEGECGGASTFPLRGRCQM